MDWARILENIATITVPLALYMLANRARAKRESEEKHLENKKVLEDILVERMYFPPHEHMEKQGPLNADGIRRIPDKRRW